LGGIIDKEGEKRRVPAGRESAGRQSEEGEGRVMSWAQFSGYFTQKFWKDHVYEGSERLAKRDAEEIYQRRDVSVSSVLEMDRHAIRVLVGEITRRQPEYAAAPNAIFTSQHSFAYWERRLKRAKRMGPAQFRYGVRYEDGVYKIHHFDGVV
jgi:hypothetical protein